MFLAIDSQWFYHCSVGGDSYSKPVVGVVCYSLIHNCHHQVGSVDRPFKFGIGTVIGWTPFFITAVFFSGAFFSSTFFVSTFFSSTFFGGTFFSGTFFSGTFFGSTFFLGTFFSGTSFSSTFFLSTFFLSSSLGCNTFSDILLEFSSNAMCCHFN